MTQSAARAALPAGEDGVLSAREPLPPARPPDALPPADGSLHAAYEALQRELISCQRLALLGSLSAMAAHEFNNLMTPIVARAEAALTSGDDLPFMRKALERTLTQAQRAVALSRRLLDLAHDRPLPVEPCPVEPVVREALESAARPFEKDNIPVRVEVPPELVVMARADLFCQVLLNLLLNAREAMKPAGRGTLAIAARPDGADVLIEVRDSGTGIPQELIDRVFNPFLSASPTDRPNDWQQVGLGLSVCRMIAARHDARLSVRANPEGGCTFTLRWPSATAGAARPSDV